MRTEQATLRLPTVLKIALQREADELGVPLNKHLVSILGRHAVKKEDENSVLKVIQEFREDFNTLAMVVENVLQKSQ
jgi:hypothetical protein